MQVMNSYVIEQGFIYCNAIIIHLRLSPYKNPNNHSGICLKFVTRHNYFNYYL